MFSLVYVSRATTDFDNNALQSLAQQAAEKNRRLAVTGYLSFRQGIFLQYLEGERSAVEPLMNTIAADERHDVMRQIELSQRNGRFFDHWSMRYLSAGDYAEIGLTDVLEGLMVTMVSDAFDLDSAQRMVLRLVEKIAAHRHRLSRIA